MVSCCPALPSLSPPFLVCFVSLPKRLTVSVVLVLRLYTLQTIGSKVIGNLRVTQTANPIEMTLPVLIGPNRCELIYNHDKQPLLELSLRVCSPVKELLSMLSQLAPPAHTQASKLQRTAAKGPHIGAKRKDQDVPQQGQPPAKQISLPQGSSSSDWQPPYNRWEQSLQPDWEPYPVTAGDWQGEWAHSNPQVEEQAQLLWALSDQSVSRSRKSPPIQPKPSVPVKKKTDREVRFALSPDKDKGRPCPPTVDKTVESPPRKEKREDTVGKPQEESSDEHFPPPRPGAHPKKCPVQ